MYIETRFYDTGRAEAKLHNVSEKPVVVNRGIYDVYFDEMDNLQDWLKENLVIDHNDITKLTEMLRTEEMVDISSYC